MEKISKIKITKKLMKLVCTITKLDNLADFFLYEKYVLSKTYKAF